jgi:hypothetical protein
MSNINNTHDIRCVLIVCLWQLCEVGSISVLIFREETKVRYIHTGFKLILPESRACVPATVREGGQIQLPAP